MVQAIVVMELHGATWVSVRNGSEYSISRITPEGSERHWAVSPQDGIDNVDFMIGDIEYQNRHGQE